MEINLNSIQTSNTNTVQNQTGVTAPQTESQRVDQSAQRVVSNKEAATLEDKASSSDERRFETIKSRAAQFVAGENPFFSDIKFTIYGASPNSVDTGQYEIRFTDLSNGAVEVKTEKELFTDQAGGNIISGNV